MRAIFVAATIVFSTALVSCQTASGSGDLAQSVEGRQWSAVSIGNEDVADGTAVTLKIESGRVGGKAGCNGYGGPVEIHGDNVKFGAIFSTKMACLGSGVMEQEQHYLNLLQAMTRGEIRANGDLVLHASAGAVVFRGE